MNRASAIEVLRLVRSQLEARGITRVGIFDSVARDAAGARSDIDVVATSAADRGLDLFDLGGIKTLLEEGFAGMEVDIVVEPIRRPGLRAAVERDRIDAFRTHREMLPRRARCNQPLDANKAHRELSYATALISNGALIAAASRRFTDPPAQW
jgi:uncharacterized protein